MQDRELYKQLMGLRDPWKVTEVAVDFEKLRVDVWLEWPPQDQAVCPKCKRACNIYDHREERQWRHLDTMQFQTILHCRIPRVNCPGHGAKSISVPWTEKNSRFTALFERLSIEVLLGCQNQTKAKEFLSLSWDEVHLIQEKAVQRGLQRRSMDGLRYIGVDEKSFLKGHRFATILSDINNARVMDVAQDRKEETLVELLKRIPEEQREKIIAVAIDMWEPYINAVEALLPECDGYQPSARVTCYAIISFSPSMT
jgi:transposase